MFIKIVFVMMLMISLGYAVVSVDRDNPASERYARREIDAMRGFVFSVNRFIGANHNFDGTVSWSGDQGSTALRDQPSTPASLRGVSMPPSWRAVIADGDYLLCAALSEAALALMGSDMPEWLRNDVVQTTAGKRAVVFALPKDFNKKDGTAPAQEWVQTCSS